MADGADTENAVGECVADDAASARLVLRNAGYCVLCDRIVERAADGDCPAGHPAAAVAGRIDLQDGEPVPQLPRFNLAAFLIPPVWGPFHGQWAGAIFLPIWLFADNVIASAAGRGAGAVAGSVFVALATVGAQVFFAKRANGVAWRRVASHMSVAEFSRRQRTWAFAAVPLAAILLGWATYYRLVLAG